MAKTFTFLAAENHRRADSLGAAFIDWLMANPASTRDAIKGAGHDIKHLRWDLKNNPELFLVEGEDEVKAPKAAKKAKPLSGLTAMEAKVLGAFETYSNIDDTISDLGVSWTDVESLAKRTSLNVRSVKGVIGSLVKKGLVQSDGGESGAVCLTAEGASALSNQAPAAEVEVVGAAEVEAAEAATESEIDRLSKLSAVELRKLASEAKVKNYGKMSKADLIEVLA